MIKITVTEEGIPMIWNSGDWETLRKEYRIIGSLSGTLADFPSQERFQGLPLVLLPYEATLLCDKKIARLVRYPSLTRAPGKGVKEEYDKYCQRICDGQIGYLTKKQTLTNVDEETLSEKVLDTEATKATERIEKRRNTENDWNAPQHNTLLSLAIEKLEDGDLHELMPFARSLCVQNFTTYPWLRKEDACTVKWKYPCTSAESLHFKVFKDFWEKGYYVSPGHKFGADFIIYPGDPLVYSAHFVVICIGRNAAIRPVDVAVFCRLGKAINKPVVLACETNNNEITYQTLECSILCK